MASVVTLFKRALADHLKADSGVSALVSDRVYDIPPSPRPGGEPDGIVPYVYVGPITLQFIAGIAGETAQRWRARVRLYAVSHDADREELWNVMDAVVAALTLAEVTLAAGYYAQPIDPGDAGDVIDPRYALQAFCDFSTELVKE